MTKKKEKSDNNARIIKSILSQDKTKAFVCYINNQNKCYCLTYNINDNSWNEESLYLEDCQNSEKSSLHIEYIESEYIVYCFQSNNKFNLKKFDSNFQPKDDVQNGIYNLSDSLEGCSDYYISSLAHNLNDIQIFVNCDGIIMKKSLITITTTLPATSILTTLPLTTILTTFPATTILTTLPATTILTTLPATTILTSLPATTILTTLPSKNILTTLPASTILNTFHNNNGVLQGKTNKTKDDIINNINNALEGYEVGQTLELFGDDFNVKVSPINSKTHGNISTYIDFSDCEKILRDKNELDESSILTVYQIEIDNPNQQSLINDVQYAVFNEKKEKLDLSVCSNEQIEIYYQINTSMINTSKVNYYSDLGIDVFNLDGGFFNDICYSYSEGDSDMVLDDRVTDIYQNYSICEDNCEYNSINLTENLVSCKCSVKTELVTEVKPPKLDKILRDTFEDSNLAVIKCYNLVFSIKNKHKNMGFLIFSFLVLLHIPFFIYYAIYNISSLSKFIISEMNKFHYSCQAMSPPKKLRTMRIKNKKKSTNMIKQKKDSAEFVIEKNALLEKSSRRRKMKTNLKRENISSIFGNNNSNFFEKNSKEKTKSLKGLNSKLKNKKKGLKKKRKTKKCKSLQPPPVLLVDYKVVNKNIITMKGRNDLNTTKKVLPTAQEIQIKKEKKGKIKLSSKIYALIQIDANNGG